MSGVGEIILLIVGTLLTIGIASVTKIVKNKNTKRKLKKMLKRGFKDLDYDIIRMAFRGLLDFDAQNDSRKLQKYLQKIIHQFRDDPTQMNINEKNLNMAIHDLSKLDTIFDQTEEEVQQDEDVVDEKLIAIEKKRQDIIQRKQNIRNKLIAKEKKLQRRKTNSAMG